MFSDKKTADKTLDSNTIRRAKVSLFAFLEFANLCFMVCEKVAGSYELNFKDDITSRKYFMKYIQRLIDDIVEFKAPASWTLTEIIRVHTRRSCKKTTRCRQKIAIKEGFAGFEVHTADKAWCRCLLDPTLESLKYHILVRINLFSQKICKENVTQGLEDSLNPVNLNMNESKSTLQFRRCCCLLSKVWSCYCFLSKLNKIS